MTQQELSRDVRSIFGRALELENLGERRAYLDEACADIPSVRVEVEDLLEMHERAGEFMCRPAAAGDATVHHDCVIEKPGHQIGSYKLREQIGEGGFGLVFVAEQTEPVRRKVALKIIKPGMDTREVLARFNAEQQALALMDHPNIAQVFDAGATETGRPYFVMELVKGIPIVDYCDQQQLEIEERLDLFLSVCQAVQHAHTKGVIHRDLKPSNILVAPHDGVPVVKVIDFGVAKAIGQRLTEYSIYTQFSQMIGTPLYMSPEQAEINALDVDIRSDVYSLGVLLYELLTGVTPFDRERFKTAAFEEIRRIIKEEEPPKPSTRLTTLGNLLTTVSSMRRVDSTRLSALIAGDLDWIVMKALEKERKRRYQTANELADDVRNYLMDEPVKARPPSLAYKTKKLVQRNRAAVIVAATILIAMAGTIVGTSVGLMRATQAAAEAERAATEKQLALNELGSERDKLTNAKVALEDSLRISKMSEARALIDQRATSYKSKVYEILQELAFKDMPLEVRWPLRQMALACLGDPAALKPVAELKDLGIDINEVDMTPNGKWLAISLRDGQALLIETDSQRKVSLPPAEDSRNRGIRFVNDQLLVFGIKEREYQFFRLIDGSWSAFGKPRSVNGRIADMAVSLDGTWMVLSYWKALSVWDISDPGLPVRKEVLSFPESDVESTRELLWRASIHPTGKRVAATLWNLNAQDHTVVVWDVESKTVLGTRPGKIAMFSPDGRQLAVSGDLGIEVYDTNDLDDFTNIHPVIYRREDIVGFPAFLGDGRTLIFPSSQTGSMRVWDVSANLESATLLHGFKADRIVSARNGGIVASASPSKVKLWRMNDLPERQRLAGHRFGAKGIHFSPDGRWLATTGGDSTVRLWDTETGRMSKQLDGGGQSVDFSSDGQWLVAGSDTTSQVTLWDTEDWQQFELDADVGRRTWSVHFCDGDTKLAVSGISGLRLFNLEGDAANPIADIRAKDQPLLGRGIIPHLVSDHSKLVWISHPSAGSSGNVFSYEFDKGVEATNLGWKSGRPHLFGHDMHPDGGLVFSRLESGKIEQVDFDGNQIGPAFGHWCGHLKLHPSKPWVAINSRHGPEIWNREKGRLNMVLPQRGAVIWHLAWNPTQDQLAIAYSNGLVDLWNIEQVQQELRDLGL